MFIILNIDRQSTIYRIAAMDYSKRINSLAFSLKPLIIFTKLFGYNLNSISARHEKSIVARWILPSLAWLFLFTNCAVNFLSAASLIPKKFNNIMDMAINTQMEQFCRIELAHLISFVFRLFETSGVPAIFTIHLYLTGRWTQLWSILDKIEEEMGTLPAKFNRKCRKRCYLAFALLILVIIDFMDRRHI